MGRRGLHHRAGQVSTLEFVMPIGVHGRTQRRQREEEMMNANESVASTEVTPVTTDKLVADLRILVIDVEQLLKLTLQEF